MDVKEFILDAKKHGVSDNWITKYLLLRKYYLENGSLSRKLNFYDVNLKTFFTRMRTMYRDKDKYANFLYEKKLLNELNFDWNSNDTAYLHKCINENNKEKYNKILNNRLDYILDDLIDEGKNTITNMSDVKDIEEVVTKRMWKYFNEIKKPKRKENKHMTNWLTKYSILLDYYNEHGDCNVKSDSVIDGINMGYWLNQQRKNYKDGNLSDIKIQLLEKLNIKWYVKDANWNYRYKLLKEYYMKNGTTKIPVKCIIDGIDMDKWVQVQKRAYENKNTSTLSKDRIALLNDIEFDFQPSDTNILNKKITNYNEYKKIMLNRMRHILDDLSYEINGKITDKNKQNIIVKEITKRMWR